MRAVGRCPAQSADAKIATGVLDVVRGELGEDEITGEPAGLAQATARDAQHLLGNARRALHEENRSSVGADRSVAGRR